MNTLPVLYVKKLRTLHPRQFKLLTYNQAQSEYQHYLVQYGKFFQSKLSDNGKTFRQWLKTEI